MNQKEIRETIESELQIFSKEGVAGWKIRRLRDQAPKYAAFGQEAAADKTAGTVDSRVIQTGVRGLLKNIDAAQALGFRAGAEEFLAQERKKKSRECCSKYKAAYLWPFCIAGC